MHRKHFFPCIPMYQIFSVSSSVKWKTECFGSLLPSLGGTIPILSTTRGLSLRPRLPQPREVSCDWGRAASQREWVLWQLDGG